jgi:hypothetical protein
MRFRAIALYLFSSALERKYHIEKAGIIPKRVSKPNYFSSAQPISAFSRTDEQYFVDAASYFCRKYRGQQARNLLRGRHVFFVRAHACPCQGRRHHDLL